MAGRILPVALAIISGVSIGVATFDGEFKEQRRQRLQEEYDQEVAAAAAVKKSAVPTAPNAQSISLPAPKQSEPSASWSSMLGLWAWKKDDAKQTESEKRGEEKS